MKHQPQFYPIIACGLRTGLRIGELLALKWEDLDFFNKTIHVQRDITYGTYYKWLPKLSVSDIDELDKRMLENATIHKLSATG